MAKLTPAQIVEQESAKFIDSQFGGLDLSGCPTALAPPNEDELPDQRFAPLDDRGAGLGAASLKQEIEKMIYDPEVQAQVARETGDPELLANLQEEQAVQVALEFRRQNSGYFKDENNWERMVGWMADSFLGWDPDEVTPGECQGELIRRGYWTVPNLTAAFKALSREGSLESDPANPRQLSEHQRRSIAIQASTGDVEGAISRYIKQRLPERAAQVLDETFGLEDMYDQLAEPEYKSILEEAVWFSWQFARPNYAPTRERKAFMKTYIAGRIPTTKLLDEAWRECQVVEKDALRAGILAQVDEPEAPDLDRLSDQEIDALYHGSLRHVVEQARSRSVGATV